ncbi:hypothetical protein FOBRF1_012116 [Fusarium oxysporum]
MSNNNILVVQDQSTVQTTSSEGPTAWIDLVGTPENAEQPLTAGIWTVGDINETTPAWESDLTEFKYFISGEITLKDERSQKEFALQPGSLVWVPKGAKLSIVRSKNARFVYVEQRKGNPAIGTGVN